jgi:aspartate/methionine/tyrosine aminotransferase
LVHDVAPSTLLSVTDQHFVVNSFSKSHAAAGIRIGHLVMPEKYVDTGISIKASLNVCTSIPAQILAHRILNSHKNILCAHKKYLRENYLLFKGLCEENGLRILGSPQAGFFSAIDISGVSQESAFELALELIREEGVATCPGTDFGSPDPMFLRLNYSVDGSHLSRGISRIARYLNAR